MFAPARPGVFSTPKCSTRRVLIFVLPWIVAVLFGTFFILNTRQVITPAPKEEEEFDWGMVEWKHEKHAIEIPKIIDIKTYGFLIQPAIDTYITQPRLTKSLYSVIPNCTFDEYGYFIKNKEKYPTSHPWLTKQYIIDEDIESGDYNPNGPAINFTSAIPIFISSVLGHDIVPTRIIPMLLSLPSSVLRTVPIVVHTEDPYYVGILFEYLKYFDVPRENIQINNQKIFAETMYVIDYPDTEAYMRDDILYLAQAIRHRISSTITSGINVIATTDHDPRLTNVEDSIDVLRELTGRVIKTNTKNYNTADALTMYYKANCILNFDGSFNRLSFMMRPGKVFIYFGLDSVYCDGVRFAQLAGARVFIIGAKTRQMNAKGRRAIAKLIEAEFPEVERAGDNETPVLDFGEIDDLSDLEQVEKEEKDEIQKRIEKEGQEQ